MGGMSWEGCHEGRDVVNRMTRVLVLPALALPPFVPALVLALVVTSAAMLSSAAMAEEEAPDLRAALSRNLDQRDYDTLAAHGADAMPVLIELYRTAETDRRTAIAHGFYRLGFRSEAAKELLMADAKSLDEDLRIAAQYALGRVSDDPAIVDLLVDNLQSGFNPLVRDKAACGLAYDQIHLDDRQKARLFRRMIELLDSPNPETRWLAIRVLKVHTGQVKGFFPQWPEDRRIAAVERWKRWIEEYEANL